MNKQNTKIIDTGLFILDLEGEEIILNKYHLNKLMKCV